MHTINKRCLSEVVELTRDCDLGLAGERAVVTVLDLPYMTMVFPNRAVEEARVVHTGADYVYLKPAGPGAPKAAS